MSSSMEQISRTCSGKKRKGICQIKLIVHVLGKSGTLNYRHLLT